MPKQPIVNILASKRNGTIYTGVISYLVQRLWQHKNNVFDAHELDDIFTARRPGPRERDLRNMIINTVPHRTCTPETMRQQLIH